MRSFVILSLALLCLSAAGQAGSSSVDDITDSALRSLLAGSSASLESYRFLMDMSQEVDLVNLSTNESQNLAVRTFGFGSANMTDRALKLSLVALTYERDSAENASPVALEEYLINDTIYMKMDGNWTALKMPSVADAWSDQNTLDRQLKIFNSSRLTLQGSESLEGRDCYKVLAEMDLKPLAGELSGEAASILPELGLNYSEVFSNSSLMAVYWIDKETHNLRKAEVEESFIINSLSLGLPAKEVGAVEMRINSDVTMLFQGYNEEVAINLPAETQNATAISAGPTAAGAEAAPSAPAFNETEINEIAQNESLSQLAQNQSQIPIPAENQTSA
ncbi:MAG: hypothetical protein ACP5OU_00600 [Methanothrix sp.]